MIHAFWECYEVLRLWAELERWLSEVSQCQFTFNPSICIFEDMAYGGVVRYPNGLDNIILVNFCILKKLLLKYWKSNDSPTLRDWKDQMLYYLKLHYVTFRANRPNSLSVPIRIRWLTESKASMTTAALSFIDMRWVMQDM